MPDSTQPDDASDTPQVIALCPGCAKETGLDDDEHSAGPELQRGLGCSHCGATLPGFFYVVPRDAYTGMAPGAG